MQSYYNHIGWEVSLKHYTHHTVESSEKVVKSGCFRKPAS